MQASRGRKLKKLEIHDFEVTTNILTDELPGEIVCGVFSCPVKTDFRSWLRFGQMLCDVFKTGLPDNDGALSKENCDLLIRAIECVVPFGKVNKLSCSLSELIYALCGFYTGVPGKEASKRGKNGKSGQPIYDFYRDADYIFASFFEVYGIDLTLSDMHWHKFLALFRSLPENCKFSKVLSYRTCDTSKMTGEEKKFYTEMKSLYALPDNRSRLQRDADVYAEIASVI